MRHTDLVAVARPFMDQLLERFREIVNLCVIMDGKGRRKSCGLPPGLQLSLGFEWFDLNNMAETK